MTALWTRIEPLLGQVQKPARYIGCEDGAITPRHGPGRVSWLLAYPDTYEIGLPNQGLQILYEILNERDDAVAERTYAPWRDLDGLLRRAPRPAVLGRHPPRRRRLRPARVQPRRRARLHQRAGDDRPRRRARAGGRPAARGPVGRDRRALRVQPRTVGRLRRRRRARRRGGGRRRDHRGRRRVDPRRARRSRPRAARAGPDPRRLRALAVRRHLRRSVPDRRHAPVSRRAGASSTSARSPTWGSGRTRSASSSR